MTVLLETKLLSNCLFFGRKADCQRGQLHNLSSSPCIKQQPCLHNCSQATNNLKLDLFNNNLTCPQWPPLTVQPHSSEHTCAFGCHWTPVTRLFCAWTPAASANVLSRTWMTCPKQSWSVRSKLRSFCRWQPRCTVDQAAVHFAWSLWSEANLRAKTWGTELISRAQTCFLSQRGGGTSGPRDYWEKNKYREKTDVWNKCSLSRTHT